MSDCDSSNMASVAHTCSSNKRTVSISSTSAEHTSCSAASRAVQVSEGGGATGSGGGGVLGISLLVRVVFSLCSYLNI